MVRGLFGASKWAILSWGARIAPCTSTCPTVLPSRTCCAAGCPLVAERAGWTIALFKRKGSSITAAEGFTVIWARCPRSAQSATAGEDAGGISCTLPCRTFASPYTCALAKDHKGESRLQQLAARWSFVRGPHFRSVSGAAEPDCPSRRVTTIHSTPRRAGGPRGGAVSAGLHIDRMSPRRDSHRRLLAIVRLTSVSY